jgi:hypothetical protein
LSQLIAKLMLALLMLPTAGVLYLLTFIVAMEWSGWQSESLVFTAVSAAVLAYVTVYWMLLWRKTIVWTPRRLAATLAVSVAALLIGLVCGIFAAALLDEPAFGLFTGSLCTAFAWLFATVLIWRETNEERSNRIRAAGSDAIACANCGYNLTGLKHTKCPECGADPTIEELFASQPARADNELL